MARDAFKVRQYLDGLTGEGCLVFTPHLGPACWYSPCGTFKVKLCPFRLSQFARTRMQKRHKLQGCLCFRLAFIGPDGPQECSEGYRVKDGSTMRDLRRDSAPNKSFVGSPVHRAVATP